MPSSKAAPKSLVEAVQSVFDALEPFDETARQRIISSAASLLGTRLHIPSQIVESSQARPIVAATSRLSTDRPLSPVELVQQKNPATNPQRIAVFAYYRERFEGLSRFSKDDLKPYFAKTRQPAPRNYDRDYRDAVKVGWIYDDDADSYLTTKGLEAVEAGFSGRALPRGVTFSQGARKKRKKKRTAKG